MKQQIIIIFCENVVAESPTIKVTGKSFHQFVALDLKNPLLKDIL